MTGPAGRTEEKIIRVVDDLVGRQGAYALVFRNMRSRRVRTGALGSLSYDPGIWVYVGSAMGKGSASLGRRLGRHFHGAEKKHWHIDHLLSEGAKILGAFWIENKRRYECRLVAALQRSGYFTDGPRGFGSSDCRSGCGTHLLRYMGKGGLVALKTVMAGALHRDARFLAL